MPEVGHGAVDLGGRRETLRPPASNVPSLALGPDLVVDDEGGREECGGIPAGLPGLTVQQVHSREEKAPNHIRVKLLVLRPLCH